MELDILIKLFKHYLLNSQILRYIFIFSMHIFWQGKCVYQLHTKTGGFLVHWAHSWPQVGFQVGTEFALVLTVELFSNICCHFQAYFK